MYQWNRRRFLAVASTAAVALRFEAGTAQTVTERHREVFLVPNFHPASCGWLTTFSRERVYCANSYLDHLDRVRDDPRYRFVMSEINNIIAIRNFQPQRIPELLQRVKEGRVELVNGFFLESTINLSGGEALVRLGVEGLRWYRQMFNIVPRYAWTIDVCGTHDQMAQIAVGLGLKAMVYTRGNPTGKTIHWFESPDGSRVLSFCPGHYSEATPIFKTTIPLDATGLGEVEKLFHEREGTTPDGVPVLILAGSGDYATAPVLKSYPTQFLEQWKRKNPGWPVRFATLSDYVDGVRAKVDAGAVKVPVVKGGTAYQFDAFWIENNEVKTRYRASEQALQAAEKIATIASLHARHTYPAGPLYKAWVLMCLNMDRNTLWGSAGGMVFRSDQSWDVQDRFNWVDAANAKAAGEALESLGGPGDAIALFNPLNWRRRDPVILPYSAQGASHGAVAELMPDGRVLCEVNLGSLAVAAFAATEKLAQPPTAQALPGVIETDHYSAAIDASTGELTSLKLKSTGRELLGGPANVIRAERPIKNEPAPADFMAPEQGRTVLDTSTKYASTIQYQEGTVAFTVQVDGAFFNGTALRRTMRFYRHSPRIDFETEVHDIPTYTVITAQFPLAGEVAEIRRGIPYGFSHGAWAKPDADLHGWTKGITPAVRWSDYDLNGAGVALFDRGLSGREIVDNTPCIFLLNAEDAYHGFPNAWLSGKGEHRCEYALFVRDTPWEGAGVARAAWEYAQPPLLHPGAAQAPERSFLETSENVIVEAVRREGDHIEIRFVECLGIPGTATLKVDLPHRSARITTMTGEPVSELPAGDVLRIPVRAQQIVTVQLETSETIPMPQPVTQWDEFVPEHKLPALHRYDASLKGHPPFGDGTDF